MMCHELQKIRVYPSTFPMLPRTTCLIHVPGSCINISLSSFDLISNCRYKEKRILGLEVNLNQPFTVCATDLFFGAKKYYFHPLFSFFFSSLFLYPLSPLSLLSARHAPDDAPNMSQTCPR